MAAFDEDSRKEVAKFEALAETAYDEMYDSRAPAGCYSNLKDYFAIAIGLAERAGLHDDAKRLSARLDHCKKVYRSQFAGF
jgi:pyruvate carboxylase